MNARESLLKVRAGLIRKLRLADPLTTAELERVDRALEALDPRETVGLSSDEFAGLRIVEAAQNYLRRIRRETHRDELVKALIDGGLETPGGRAPEWKIAQSIAWHATKGTLTYNKATEMVGIARVEEEIAQVIFLSIQIPKSELEGGA